MYSAFSHSYLFILMKQFLLILCFFLLGRVSVFAQEQPDSTQQNQTLRVYIDCRTYYCDFDFFRTEITFVDYMRDPEDADVHVLVTTQTTGSGGTEFTLNFIGREEFEEVTDILTTSSAQTDTDDEVRRRLVRVLKAGLMPYVSRTSLIDRIAISYQAQQRQQDSTQPQDDPWNYWVFRSRISGYTNGEDRFKMAYLSGSVSASRVTEDWKINFSTNGSRRIQTFEFSSGVEEKDVQESYSFSGLFVKSLNDHWSAGLRSTASRSTRSNYDLSARLAPAIEYNIFPYAESTRRQFTIQYAVGVSHFNYTDSTIFNKMEETLIRQTLGVALAYNQPWGEVNTYIEGGNFMHDLDKLTMDVGGSVEVRVFRGLSFNIGGYVSLVRDQLNIARGDATNEDVLLRRRELETDWRYFTSFGISYTFGSIFNNIVNPRFGGSSGGNIIIMM